MPTASHGFWGKTKHFFSSFFSGCRKTWRWYKGCFVGRPWWQKTIAAILSFFVFLLIYIIAVSLNLFWLFGKSPSIGDIMHPKNPEASVIMSADGVQLAKIYHENREGVPYDSIAPVFFDALISTEDERFYSHHGVDFQGLAAAAKDAAKGRARGASTISQQLVKNMFRVRSQYSTGLLGKIPGLRMLIMKSKEMIIATELELTNSKQDILRMYANTVDFGCNAYGIKTASRTYFNKTPDQLNTQEAAVLVGLLKATSSYNPKTNPTKSRERRNIVLENLYTHGKLTRTACDSLKELPIELHFTQEDPNEGTAKYFTAAVVDYVKAKCPDVDPYEDGLLIYTTLDSKMQRYAEEAVRTQMRIVQRDVNRFWNGRVPWRGEDGRAVPHFIDDIARRSDAFKTLLARFPNDPDSIRYYMNKPHKVKLFSYDGPITAEMSSVDSIKYMVKFMHTGFVAMEPSTGYVRAWVGDLDYDTWQFDNIRSTHQPGSTFKLFVYAAAMENGLVPMDHEVDEKVEMDVYDEKNDSMQHWVPTNANGRYSNADVTLRSAFARSINTVAVKLGQRVGINDVIRTAQSMGIKSTLDNTPALALGSSDANVLEMVNAYATVANGGIQVEPVLVTQILTSDGDILFEASTKETRAISQRSAFYMQRLLEAAIFDGGATGHTLKNYVGTYCADGDLSVGGKTGTTNNHSDAWFVGVTPNLVGGAWVGGQYRCVHGISYGSGAALPIFGLFMQKVLNNPTLRGKYMRHYDGAPADIDPATYGGDIHYGIEPEQPDSLAVPDSLALNAENNEEEYDPDAEPREGDNDEDAASNKTTTTPATTQSSAPGNSGAKPSRGSQQTPTKQSTSGEDLFN